MNKQLQAASLTEQQEKFIACIPNHKTLNAAAREAGYTDNTAKNIKQMIAKSKTLQRAIKDFYLANNIPQLHQIMQIEQGVLDLCQNDINKVKDHRQTIKEIKQQAGVLQPDHDNKPNLTYISITARSLMIDMDSIPEAEVIND